MSNECSKSSLLVTLPIYIFPWSDLLNIWPFMNIFSIRRCSKIPKNLYRQIVSPTCMHLFLVRATFDFFLLCANKAAK